MLKTVNIKRFMVIIAVLCVLQITAISMASCTPIVAVNPGDKCASTGDVFTINITVNPQGCDIYGAQYGLTFDPMILQVVEQTKGEFLTQDGASTIEITNSYNNTIGTLEYGETRVKVGEGVTSKGTLASITFEVVANTGRTDLTLSNVVLSDPYSQRFEGIGINNGVVRIVTPSDTSVSVEPAHSVVSAGDVFVINVSVDPAGEVVSGVQYDLTFDPTVLQVVEQTKGEFLTQDGASSIEVTNSYNNTVGKLEYGEARIGTMEGVTGKGTLASITFEVVATSGKTDLTLSNVVLSDPYARRLEGFGVYNGVVTLGTHIDTSVGVEPAYSVVSAGDVFTIHIGVDPAGETVYGAQYDLAFDPAILQVREQTKGEFLAQDGAGTIEIANSYNNSIGTLEYGETRAGTDVGVMGKGTLASITFEVVANTGRTDLTLSNVTLSDPSSQQLVGVAVNNGVLIIESHINHSNTSVSVEPAYSVVSVGDVFVINIGVDPVGEVVYGAQYDLAFDPAILQVIEQTKGGFLAQDGAKTIEIINNYNNSIGTLEYGETRVGTDEGVTNKGTLASITFEVVANTGGTDLTLSNVDLSDTRAMSIDAVIYSGRVDIAEMPSCNAIITIPDIASVGTTAAPVTIKNGTNIGSCDLTLVFDPSVVLVHNVSGGDFDSLLSNQEIVYISSTTTNTTTGLLRIGAFQDDSPGLNEDIVIANVTFIPVGDIGSSTKLSIKVTTLKDASPACNLIPYTVENGSFTVFLNGDVNGDGVVDIADCMYLAKHLLETPGFEHIIAIAADVNGDGVIDIADCMYLAKHILGITGFEVLK